MSGALTKDFQFGINYGWIKASLQRWTNDDEQSQSSPVSVKGLRLIDCRQGIVVSAPENCSYFALSYVWSTRLQNTISDLTNLNDKALETLPCVVSDAINATLELGRCYLWVDAFCIDSKSHTHRAAQIAQMGEIYANAEATIVSLGKDCHSHLPRVSNPRTVQMVPIGSVGIVELRGVYTAANVSNEVQTSTW